MQYGIKLQQKSKELVHQCRKVQLLSRPSVQPELDKADEFVG